MGGGGGGWEAEDGLKQPFGLKQQSVWDQNVQSMGWAKTAIRSSLVPHAVLLVPLRVEKCIIVVSQDW